MSSDYKDLIVTTIHSRAVSLLGIIVFCLPKIKDPDDPDQVIQLMHDVNELFDDGHMVITDFVDPLNNLIAIYHKPGSEVDPANFNRPDLVKVTTH